MSADGPLQKITLAHGSGGKAMDDLIRDVFIRAFGLNNTTLEDQARLDLAALQQQGNRLAFTTDCYVVHPLFFPGGDIGKLAVTGTVNDLAVGGAKPLYLSCGFILEEGLPVDTLKKVVCSMQQTAEAAGVSIVTGDTKVVPKGSCDKLFINTAGVGVIAAGVNISAAAAQPGDAILINGYLGDHGAAVLDARGELALHNTIESDCQPLGDLVQAMLAACPDIHCLRDVTRGGLAGVLNEFAQASDCCIEIEETRLPIRTEVRGMCEILGLDPLYLANEGKLACVVPAHAAEKLLQVMQSHPAGRHSAIIGRVKATSGALAQPFATPRVLMTTGFGSQRMIDRLVGEPLPRIC
ncbi:MAG: hydrogenase expression/formation protein HypE [Pseudomonadota bacterium]|nr:hydrogenase expression/formation protein HypE [Pseudomonadota bacterium]